MIKYVWLLYIDGDTVAGRRCSAAQRLGPSAGPHTAAGSSGAGHGRMRSDEIENAYPGLTPPPARARLDFMEGRCPFAGSPALPCWKHWPAPPQLRE